MANNEGNTAVDEFISAPFAPLGLIVMPGCEELGAKVNSWLMTLAGKPGSDRRKPHPAVRRSWGRP